MKGLIDLISMIVLYIHGIACAMICLRLYFFVRCGTYRRWVSLGAGALMLATAWTSIEIFFRDYRQADYGDAALAVLFLIIICRARGNLAKALRKPFHDQ